MKRSRLFMLIVVLLSLTMVLAACDGDDDPDVNDNVEDTIDDAADDVEDAADDAADEVDDAVDEAADDVDDAVDDLGDEEVTVSITDNEYGEVLLDVAPGTTVTWVNEGTNTHTVTADDGSFDSGDLAPGDTFSFTFDTEGVFNYHCEYHEEEGMTAAVEVSASEG